MGCGKPKVKEHWKNSWPESDFTNATIPLSEIYLGGKSRHTMKPIDRPYFETLEDKEPIADSEPVISFVNGKVARAYPIRILIYHGVVNDVVNEIPIAITYCPLTNTGVIYKRQIDKKSLQFAVSGMLRKSNTVLYDEQTKSWWQQYTGECLLGEHQGKTLEKVPCRLESLGAYRTRTAEADILHPRNPDAHIYGTNPFPGYDNSDETAFLDTPYTGQLPPMSRLLVIGEHAWPLELIKLREIIITSGIMIRWKPGQNSALDNVVISSGKDVGNITVTEQSNGADYEYRVPFAFTFPEFHPDGEIHSR